MNDIQSLSQTRSFKLNRYTLKYQMYVLCMYKSSKLLLLPDRIVKHAPAVSVNGRQVSAALEQQPDHLEAGGLGGVMQRRTLPI